MAEKELAGQCCRYKMIGTRENTPYPAPWVQRLNAVKLSTLQSKKKLSEGLRTRTYI